MISVIVIAVLVAVDLKIIFFVHSKNFSCVNLFLFDSDIFKRIHYRCYRMKVLMAYQDLKFCE